MILSSKEVEEKRKLVENSVPGLHQSTPWSVIYSACKDIQLISSSHEELRTSRDEWQREAQRQRAEVKRLMAARRYP